MPILRPEDFILGDLWTAGREGFKRRCLGQQLFDKLRRVRRVIGRDERADFLQVGFRGCDILASYLGGVPMLFQHGTEGLGPSGADICLGRFKEFGNEKSSWKILNEL